MTDLKTTVTALVTALVSLIGYFGFNIPAEWIPVISTIGFAVAFFFAKDKENKEK